MAFRSGPRKRRKPRRPGRPSIPPQAPGGPLVPYKALWGARVPYRAAPWYPAEAFPGGPGRGQRGGGGALPPPPGGGGGGALPPPPGGGGPPPGREWLPVPIGPRALIEKGIRVTRVESAPAAGEGIRVTRAERGKRFKRGVESVEPTERYEPFEPVPEAGGGGAGAGGGGGGRRGGGGGGGGETGGGPTGGEPPPPKRRTPEWLRRYGESLLEPPKNPWELIGRHLPWALPTYLLYRYWSGGRTAAHQQALEKLRLEYLQQLAAMEAQRARKANEDFARALQWWDTVHGRRQ